MKRHVYTVSPQARPVRIIPAPQVILIPIAVGNGYVQPERTWKAVAEVAGKIVDFNPDLQQGAFVAKGDLLVGIAPEHEDTPFFISPVNRRDSWKDKQGEWKHSPVRGGAGGEAESPGTFNMFSDWSVRKMQLYMERRLVEWDDEIQRYRKWSDYRDCYFRPLKNDGVKSKVE